MPFVKKMNIKNKQTIPLFLICYVMIGMEMNY